MSALLVFAAFVSAAPLSATVPLSVHIEATESDAWLSTLVDEANRVYEPLGLTIDATVVERGAPAEITTVAGRNALATRGGAGEIHVFVVDRLADKARPGVWIAGVHWRSQGPHRGRRYIIVSRSAARVDTLAHELGHFFGLPHHPGVDNVMKRRPRARVTTFDARQARIIRRAASRFTTKTKPSEAKPARVPVMKKPKTRSE